MYLGNQPALAYTSLAKQDFTTSATTSYVLDNPVANENEIALFINFVRQEPTTAYTASGTSLTLTSATSASDDMYAIFLGKAVQTVNPPAGSVGISQLSATGTKDSTTFLRGDNTFNTPPAGAFVFLGETTASNVASVDLNGYFTSDYDIYKIFIDGLYGSTNDVRVHMQFSTGSYTVQTSNYYSANVVGYQNNGAQGSYGEGVFNGSHCIICEYLSSTSTQQSNIELTLYNPLTTSYVKSYSNAFRGTIGNITGTRVGCGGGSWNDTTAITGVRFLMASGNISARKIKIYGVKNS